jgi:hypothetical protein
MWPLLILLRDAGSAGVVAFIGSRHDAALNATSVSLAVAYGRSIHVRGMRGFSTQPVF